LIMFWMQCYI